MATPVLALAVTAISAPIISISALPPSSSDSTSSDTSTRSYPLSAATPFNLLLLAPVFGCISLGLGVLTGMFLHRRCLRRKRGKVTTKDNLTFVGCYPTGPCGFQLDEGGGFVVGATSEGDSQTPTYEKTEDAALLSRHTTTTTNLPPYDQDSDAWDASNVRTPLLQSAEFTPPQLRPNLHAVGSPAVDAHSAALWLAATAQSPRGRQLMLSRPVNMRARSTSASTYAPTPLLDETMDVPEPPFDYEVSMLYESQEGLAR